MDDLRYRSPDPTGPALHAAGRLLLGGALLGVAALTLTPQGTGWTWGSPGAELEWYSTGLDSAATVRQLAGNLALFVVPAVLAVLLWPEAGRPDRLARLALAAGAGIELLQWSLPLGRVVSPLDAALNALGAVVAGLLVRHLQSSRTSPGRRGGTPPAPSALAGTVQSGHMLVRHN